MLHFLSQYPTAPLYDAIMAFYYAAFSQFNPDGSYNREGYAEFIRQLYLFLYGCC